MKTKNEIVRDLLGPVIAEQLDNSGEMVNLCFALFNRFPPENVDPAADPEAVKWVSDILALTRNYREQLETIQQKIKSYDA